MLQGILSVSHIGFYISNPFVEAGTWPGIVTKTANSVGTPNE